MNLQEAKARLSQIKIPKGHKFDNAKRVVDRIIIAPTDVDLPEYIKALHFQGTEEKAAYVTGAKTFDLLVVFEAPNELMMHGWLSRYYQY